VSWQRSHDRPGAYDLAGAVGGPSESRPAGVGWYNPAPNSGNGRPRPSSGQASTPGIDLATAHAIFRGWFGPGYDLDTLDVMLCTLAVERLDGDALWLLLVSGSGAAKTETAQACAGANAIITSTITSEGALLSATPKRERENSATGGLLRRLGERGVLVIKDVTSILSMNSNSRGPILAAIREIYDGYWERNVGTDGGRSIPWSGRIAVIGAVTTAWDRCHDVIAAMGDRFVILRMDSGSGRSTAGRQAMRNTGSESRMREQLAGAVGGVMARLDTTTDFTLTDDEVERLLAAADLVTRTRTGVDYDNRGDPIDAHAPEMPTRFAKQLQQIIRGGLALGMDRAHAVRLALRCARDSMPPLRLAILLDVAAHPGSHTKEVRRRLDKPPTTIRRQLQSLQMLDVLTCEEEDLSPDKTTYRYYVAPNISPDVLRAE
jgi:hypothetical protein